MNRCSWMIAFGLLAALLAAPMLAGIPSCTIEQAVGQPDPTNTASVDFTVTFSEDVTGFSTIGVEVSGSTAPGVGVASVTPVSASVYTVTINGMTGSGLVVPTVLANSAQSVSTAENNTASTSTDNQVTYDNQAPTVSVNQAVGQTDPTSSSPINFRVQFNENVTGFTSGDIAFTGSTAGGTLAASITGGPADYNVAVSGMTTTGLVVIVVATGAAQDAATNNSAAPTVVDDQVQWNPPAPTVTIDQAGAQADPTNGTTINFTVVFSENVSGFATGDVTLTGTAGATTGTVSGGPTTYNVAVTGMTGPGTVIANINASVCTSTATSANNAASTSSDNVVTFDNVAPTVTVDQAIGQTDPTSTTPINFRVQFSESVTGFVAGDIAFTGSTAGGTLAAVITGGPSDYNVAVSGMTTTGTVIIIVATGAADDAATNPSAAPTNTDNQVTWNPTTDPTVTINQAGAQADPTNGTTINFTVIFSENVSGFATGDVTLTGTAGATTGTVSGGPATYNVAVTGMTGAGTVIATINASVCTSVATSQPNQASTSTDNTVTFDNVAPTVAITQAVGQTDPTGTAPINFRVLFSESVTGFASGDITFTGSTAGGTLAATITGGPADYNVAVSGMTTGGNVIVILATGAASDAAGNTSAAPTNTDNQVTWNPTTPSITVTSPNGGEGLTVGNMTNITWTNGGGFSGTVDIALSTDGGGSFPVVVATAAPNTGTFSWTIPNNPSTTCRIRVQANAGGTPTDSSNSNFTIAVATPATITVLSPNGGESRVINSGALITWTNGGGFTGNVDILLSTDGGTSFPNTVVSNFANNGFYNWTVPNLPTTTARIRVRATGTGVPTDDSNANFTIVAGTLGGAVGNAGGADVSRQTSPGNSVDGLHFQVANDAQSPAALTITSIRIAIATNDNASNVAITHLAGVRLQRSNGSNIETVLNGGSGWSVGGTTVTVTFGSVTPLAFNVPVGGSVDFWVELFFTNVTVVGVPVPAFACSIDNTGGNALNGGGTANYPGVVAGGSITLANSVPGDEIFDDSSSDCTTSEGTSRTLWVIALLGAVFGTMALRKRLRVETSR